MSIVLSPLKVFVVVNVKFLGIITFAFARLAPSFNVFTYSLSVNPMLFCKNHSLRLGLVSLMDSLI